MKVVRTTDNEILSRLTREAKGKAVVLTYAHKLFFLRLLDFATRAGTKSDNGLTVSLTVEGLAIAVDVPTRTTIQSLNRLVACGALQRTAGEKSFPRSPTATTVIDTFYKKEKSK